MSEQEVEDLILFGKNAKRILEDPIFIQVMQTVRDDIHLSWSQTNPRDSEDREQYYNLLKNNNYQEQFESQEYLEYMNLINLLYHILNTV